MTAVPEDADRSGDRSGPEERERERAEVFAMLHEMHRLPPDEPRREELREKVVAGYMSYARHVASRYGMHGDDARDLTQAAYLGLVKAVDNYDPSFETTFLTYATPMISGEIKRHFRDTTWDVHVPRRMQELSSRLRPAVDELTQELGRSPTVTELAQWLGTTEEDVVDGLDAIRAHNAVSLDVPATLDDGDGTALGDMLGTDDPEIGLVVDREALKPALAELSDREKRILLMRYFRNMTQAEIGQVLGVSQMQVSRLLSQITARLRERLGVESELRDRP